MYKSFKKEEMKRKNTQKILEVKDKKLLEVTASLNKAEKEKLSSEAALKTAEKQVETQRLQLRQANEDYATAKKLIEDLKNDLQESDREKEEAIKAKEEPTKAKEEVEKAKDQVEQDGYEVRVAETTENFKAQVLDVYRHYCLRVWNEALSQVGIDASFNLWKTENVYFTPAIRASTPPQTKMVLSFKEQRLNKVM